MVTISFKISDIVNIIYTMSMIFIGIEPIHQTSMHSIPLLSIILNRGNICTFFIVNRFYIKMYLAELYLTYKYQ